MLLTALLIISSLWIAFGLFLYVRVNKMSRSIKNRIDGCKIFIEQQSVFKYVLFLIRISVLSLVILIVFFIY